MIELAQALHRISEAQARHLNMLTHRLERYSELAREIPIVESAVRGSILSLDETLSRIFM